MGYGLQYREELPDRVADELDGIIAAFETDNQDIVSTPGPTGPAGADGLSAYEQAVLGGYGGSESDFYADLAAVDDDADTLDGHDSTYFTNATNLASGTVPDARFPATLPAASGANLTNLAPANVVAGTFGVVLSNSAQPRCSVYSTATQTLGTGPAAATAVTFTTATEDFDVGAMHDTSTNKSRITAANAGVYLLVGYVYFNSNGSAGARQVYWRKNGTDEIGPHTQEPGNTTIGNGLTSTLLVTLAAGDYVELMMLQDSGANVTTGDGSFRSAQNMAQAIKIW